MGADPSTQIQGVTIGSQGPLIVTDSLPPIKAISFPGSVMIRETLPVIWCMLITRENGWC